MLSASQTSASGFSCAGSEFCHVYFVLACTMSHAILRRSSVLQAMTQTKRGDSVCRQSQLLAATGSSSRTPGASHVARHASEHVKSPLRTGSCLERLRSGTRGSSSWLLDVLQVKLSYSRRCRLSCHVLCTGSLKLLHQSPKASHRGFRSQIEVRNQDASFPAEGCPRNESISALLLCMQHIASLHVVRDTAREAQQSMVCKFSSSAEDVLKS